MLIHTNKFEDVIYYNRQYPFYSSKLLDATHTFINDLWINVIFYAPQEIGFNSVRLGKNQEEEFKFEHSYLAIRPGIIVDMQSVLDYSEYLGYEDLLYSDYYLPIVSMSSKGMRYRWQGNRQDIKNAFHKAADLTIGRSCKCVKCGKRDIEQAESFLCDDCIVSEDADEDYFLVCGCCGSRIYPGDPAHVDENSVWFCEECWENMQSNKEKD